MAYIKGTATFTNGSATVTSVSLNQGVISLISSGTNLVVGFDPVVGNIEATGTNGTDITLRNVWSGTTGSYEFVAFDTIEGLADAVQSARGFSTALQDALNTIGTPSTTVTPDSIAKRDSAGRLESATGASGNDVLTFGNVQTSSTDSTAGRVMTVGAFGLGSNIGITGDDLDDVLNGFRAATNDAPNNPTGVASAVAGFDIGYADDRRFQMFGSISNDQVFFRRNRFGTFEDWQELYHTGNTTVDGSGFIKEASPIVRVFADKAEFNNQCPDEIEFEKVGTGHYLIKNTLGFAQKGWYIETPKDANNNVKVYVEYDQLEDDTIEIKTYEPDYSNGYCGNGEPTDITKDRWIDVRLESEATTLNNPDSN